MTSENKRIIALQAPDFHNNGLISYNEMLKRVNDTPIHDLTLSVDCDSVGM